MPFSIEGRTVYRIGEALEQAHVSRATFFRWIKDGKIRDTQYKDRNGRRVFTPEELEDLKHAAGKLIESPQMSMPLKFRL